MLIAQKLLGRFARPAQNEREDNYCFCENDLRFLIACLVFEIYAIKVGKFGPNMVKRIMLTTLPLSPDGEITSTLHYFCIKLHHFASRMTPIDTHFFIPIPSKTRFCKTLSNLCAKLVIFQNDSNQY